LQQTTFNGIGEKSGVGFWECFNPCFGSLHFFSSKDNGGDGHYIFQRNWAEKLKLIFLKKFERLIPVQLGTKKGIYYYYGCLETLSLVKMF